MGINPGADQQELHTEQSRIFFHKSRFEFPQSLTYFLFWSSLTYNENPGIKSEAYRIPVVVTVFQEQSRQSSTPEGISQL